MKKEENSVFPLSSLIFSRSLGEHFTEQRPLALLRYPFMDALRAYLSLSLTPGLGSRKIKVLSEHFGGAEAVWEAEPEALQEVEGIGPKLIQTLAKTKDSQKISEEVEKEIERAEHLSIALLHLEHPDYPESLRNIYDPPPLIYVRGTLPPTLSRTKAIGIVGTRNASQYALNLSLNFSKDLSRAGIAVISGLALGVDSAAHKGAVQTEGGQTVAVLGSGVDVIYPRQNQQLVEEILDGHGAVVSEYRIGSGPRAMNFPGRNRIINGLSKGVLVVEGGLKSGALITAEFALEEGRTIFAIPGKVGDPKAEGTLALLKQGATMVQGASDILQEFGWREASAEENEVSLTSLEEPGRSLVRAIQERGSPLLDDLIAATGKDAADLLPTLMLLELRGVVKPLPGGRYISLI